MGRVYEILMEEGRPDTVTLWACICLSGAVAASEIALRFVGY